MVSLKKISAGLALTMACGATLVQAAPIVTITPTYTHTTRLATHPLGLSQLGPVDISDPAFSGTNFSHRIEVFMNVSGFGASDDLAGLLFNIDFGAGLTKNGNWAAAPYDLVNMGADDEGIPLPKKPQFATNQDAGTSATDLKAVAIQIGSDVAKVTHFAEGAPFKIGQFTLKWDGTSPALLTATPSAGQYLNLFANNTGSSSPTGVTLAGSTFAAGEVQFGPIGTTPSIVALLSSGLASNPNLPDVPYQYTETNQAIIDLPAGTTKAEIQFGSVTPVPSGSLYAMFWLDGTPADVAAFLVAAERAFTGGAAGGVMVTSGGIYDSLRNNFPGVDLVLQYPGQAPALNGGSLAFDFSNNGSVVVTQFAAVPEPASLLSLGGLSFLGFMLGRRRR